LDKVQEAIAGLHECGAPITFPAVARAVGVARSTLYRNPSARVLVTAAVKGHHLLRPWGTPTFTTLPLAVTEPGPCTRSVVLERS